MSDTAPRLAEPTPAPEADENPAVWMARALVESNVSGHHATASKIEELRDDVRSYGKIIVLALGLVAALAGIKIVLPDGTSIAPASAAESGDVNEIVEAGEPDETADAHP